MSDQAERVILEAEDQVTPIVGKANAGLDSFEKKAESSHGKVIRITDQTRSSVQRLIASLEKQAETYGKSGVDRLISQRDQLLQRYSREPQAIDAITRSYEKMIAVEEKAARESAALKAAKEAEEALRMQSESIRSFGERVGQFMENPLQGARGAISSVLSALGPFGVGVASGAAFLGGIAVSAFEAAKSLGEYGTSVKDTELRTGLAAKQVGQFGFAARAVGQDISIVERLMRGLSQAADDNSKEGEKARATLRGMGVDLHDAAGQLKPTSEILTEISEGLSRLPEGLQRDAAAMDLFKRVGVEAIPFMTELNENLRVAHEQGFGPTEEDIRRFQEYQREVTVLETKWDALVRKFKEGLVVTVTLVGRGADWFLNNVGTAGDDERQRREEEQARRDVADIQAAGGIGTQMSRAGHRAQVAEMERRAPGIMQHREATLQQIASLRAEQEKLVGDFGALQAIAPTSDEQARAKRAGDIQEQIQSMQKMLDDAEAATRRNDLREGKEETDRLRARFFGTHAGMEKAYADAKKDVERLQKQLFEPDKPLTKTEAQELGSQIRMAEATEARRKAALDGQKQGAEQLREFRRQAAEFEKKGDESDLSAIGKIYYQRDLVLKQAAQVKASEADIAGIRKAADEQASVLMKKAEEEFEKFDATRRTEQGKKTLALMMPSKEQMKEWEEGFTAQERIEDIGIQTQREDLRRKAARSAGMAELAGGSDEEVAQQAYETRIDLAIKLGAIEAERISKEENAAKRTVLAAQAQKDLFTELAQAQDQFEEKQAQLQQKREQALQAQMDGLQKEAEKLVNVLFTKPSNFGKDLLSTIHSAALKPVTEALGGMAANVLHPLIYGADGKGGIAGGLAGTKQDPVLVTADNTLATKQNSDALWILTSVLAQYMGRSAPSLTGHGTGTGTPNMGIASPSAFIMEVLRNSGAMPKFAEGGVTTGPSIVGEEGPELVIPLTKLRNLGLSPSASFAVGHYGPETTAALGQAFEKLNSVALPTALMAVGGPLTVSAGDLFMSLLVGGAGAVFPPKEQKGVSLGIMATGPMGGGPVTPGRFDPEVGKPLFNKATIEELQAVGRKGGLATAMMRRLRALAGAEDDALSDAVYRGPEPGPIESAHEASQKLDAQFPRLADAFTKTERDIQRQANARLGGQIGGGSNRAASQLAPSGLAAMRVPPSPEDPTYTLRWVINPETGEVAITKIGTFSAHGDPLPEHHQLIASKGWPTSGKAYDLMHRGQATIARSGKVLALGDQSGEGLEEFMAAYGTRVGFRPINNDQAAELLKAIADQWSKGPRAIVRKLPSYDDGGTVGSTGLAMVHKGEAVVPQADTLRRAIEANTAALLRFPDALTNIFGWLHSRVAPGTNNPIVSMGTSIFAPPLFSSGSTASAAPAPSGYTGGYTPAPWAGPGGYTGGSTAAPWAGGGQRGGSNLLSLLGGPGGGAPSGAAGKGGVGGIIANLKSTDWGGFNRGDPKGTVGYGPDGTPHDEWGNDIDSNGQITGVHGAAGAALFAGGTMLAEQGLLGNSRGTWAGTAEGAVGGAAIGFQMGGPVGALIGGAAGFGIGVGEMIAGVKSPQREAHDDIKSIYGVDIPQNSGTIKQVVQIAQSQFGGSISVAVRSPSVRQLVMLYSEASGQKMPLSATTPYAGSLVEQGGKVYQQASYQDGQAHVYTSNIPTLGGIAAGTYPTPGGPNTAGGSGATYLSLNISGSDAANFMTGQFVTPQFVTDQAMAAQYSSYGRTQQSANLQLPGLTVA